MMNQPVECRRLSFVEKKFVEFLVGFQTPSKFLTIAQEVIPR